MLQRLCQRYKHVVLDRAHPVPPVISLYAGVEGTLEHCIVMSAVKATEGLPVVLVAPRVGGRQDKDRPILWLEGDEAHGIEGCTSIARYLGRHWRMHPTDPEHAFLVDSLLERLERVVVTGPQPHCLHYLDSCLLPRTQKGSGWLHGFSERTMADVCWRAALTWFYVSDKPWYEAKEVPRFHMWFFFPDEAAAVVVGDE